MKEKTSSEVFLRPRFTIDLEENPEKIIQKFTTILKEKECKHPSRFSDGHIIIDVPKEEEHFWSPQLNLEIVEIAENKSMLKGLFGPKAQVWTLFMFIHFVVGIAFLLFTVMLYVKWSLEEAFIMPLMMVIFLPLLWLVLYFLGRIGKSTGHKQMDDLHNLMTVILES
ncbi:GTP-binding protein [Polaribacter uvawellassae]|uniref:GTP-binding protein n=1 Tax=Polaribacter uvawellassae TaxID=3133495 RepID=UPI00321AFE94